MPRTAHWHVLKRRTHRSWMATTYANRQNLAPLFFEHIIAKYKGTRLGRQGTDIRRTPSAAQNLAFLVSSLADDFGPSCGEHLGRSCFTAFEAATTAETDGGCILTFQRWRRFSFSILDLAARDLSTIHPQQGRLVRADHIFRDQRSRKNRPLRSWH